jgi:hypothetical protein
MHSRVETTQHAVPPDEFRYSLTNLWDVIRPCLDAAGVRSLIEVGAYTGGLTEKLLEWADGSGAEVVAIEPVPQPELLALCGRHPELTLLRKPSPAVLEGRPRPDAVVLDGDHNYYTVSEELRLIDEMDTTRFPLVMLHDVGWPHERRDSYEAPERIPEEHRQPLASDIGLVPGNPGVAPSGGLYFQSAAEREGGPGNGVLTAVEDFMQRRGGLRLAIVPAFFGLGVLWPEDADWSGKVAELLKPLDRDPLLARVEANRVAHLIGRLDMVLTVDEELERTRELERFLKLLIPSGAFAIAERLSRLRHHGRGLYSREEMQRVLDQGSGRSSNNSSNNSNGPAG